ncbi:MAG: class I SAM-dependent RNA methyltransferase [Myxococcaceae bacterium]
MNIVSNIAFGGDGVIRHEGKVVFVPFVLPGEQIEFEITQSKKSHAFGRLIRVLNSHPDRVTPKCEYYGRCGGCQLQHASYNLQLKIKQQFVEDALIRIGKLENIQVSPIIGTKHQWVYRRRINLHQRGDKKGFIGVDGHTLVEITHCEIFSGNSLDLDPDIFVQTHPEQSERLYQDLLQKIQILGTPKILDLYCGMGILTARLADLGCQITGIELNPKAINWAKKNHTQAVNWVTADVAKVTPQYLKKDKPEVVLVNPPRTGLHPEVIEALVKYKPKHIFYTSCMPATLARDLKILTQAGYAIKQCQPYDLFPQTTHVETVVCLSQTPT